MKNGEGGDLFSFKKKQLVRTEVDWGWDRYVSRLEKKRTKRHMRGGYVVTFLPKRIVLACQVLWRLGWRPDGTRIYAHVNSGEVVFFWISLVS